MFFFLNYLNRFLFQIHDDLFFFFFNSGISDSSSDLDWKDTEENRGENVYNNYENT